MVCDHTISNKELHCLVIQFKGVNSSLKLLISGARHLRHVPVCTMM